MKQVIQSDFPMPTLPSDAPRWAWDLMNTLGYALRLLAIREDKQVHEGTYAEMPDADGSKRFYYASDTDELYYDDGAWVLMNPGETPHPGTSTVQAIARYADTSGGLANSLASVDNNGSINVPAGQVYRISGVALSKGDIGLGNVSNDLQVKQSGDQTVAGVKTFSSFPVTPSSAPSSDYQVANKKYVDDSSVVFPMVVLEHRVSSGTHAGGQSSGSWATRTLNVEAVDTDSICTLSSNEFSLPAGTYDIEVYALYYATNQSQLRIYNVSDTSVLQDVGYNDMYGLTVHAAASGYTCTPSIISGRFTLTGTKTLRIESRVTTTSTTYGWGYAASFGNVEVYAIVRITKVA